MCATGAVHTDMFRSSRYLPNPVPSRNQHQHGRGLWLQSAVAMPDPTTRSSKPGASTLLKSQTYLGVQYRRLRSKPGTPKAITAMAHRSARLVYRMSNYGQQYVDKGAEYYQRRTANDKSSFSERRWLPAGKIGNLEY